jgi:hypothetical protein
MSLPLALPALHAFTTQVWRCIVSIVIFHLDSRTRAEKQEAKKPPEASSARLACINQDTIQQAYS